MPKKRHLYRQLLLTSWDEEHSGAFFDYSLESTEVVLVDTVSRVTSFRMAGDELSSILFPDVETTASRPWSSLVC